MVKRVFIATFLACGAVTASAQPAATPPPAPAVPAALTVPAGFGISVYASGLTRARLMAVSPDGVLVVAQRANVVALPDADGDGQAEPKVLLTDQPYAHSVAFANGYLYIATTPAILRVRWANGTIVGAPEKIAELPSSTPSVHSSRTIRVGPDGRLYVAMGSSCNVCVEPDPRRTTIQVFNADGTNGHTFASGIRNAVGFDWDPQGRLWAGDNGIDQAGDDMPPDEINLIEEGKNYGHPFVIGRGVASPLADTRSAEERARTPAVNPAFELPPHNAPMGVSFYTGTKFPAAYRTSLYVALHGSTDRSSKVGYKVVRLVMENGRPVRSEDFVTGWLVGADTVTGRPIGIVTGADGALYISDDNKGFIYRVFAR